MTPGDFGWVAVGGVVVVYEAVAVVRGWPLISEVMDSYRAGFPLIVYPGVIYLAGHLLRVWPAQFDPLTQLAAWAARCSN